MVAPNHPLHTHTPIQSMTMMIMGLSSVLIIHSLKMMTRLIAMVSMVSSVSPISGWIFLMMIIVIITCKMNVL